MSTNYSFMKEAKQELLDVITTFYTHAVNLVDSTYTFFKKNKNITNEFLEELNHKEEQSDLLYDDVIDSSVWIIQKNQPRAAHLRFVISCMNSAKELEKVSDYLLLIAEFLNKRKLDDKLFNNFLKSFERCSQISSTSLKLFKEHDLSETKKEIKFLLKEYELYIKTHIRDSIFYLSTKTLSEEENKMLIDLTIAFSNLEKISTHFYNVIKAFNYIQIKD